jgi:hypothetical protein
MSYSDQPNSEDSWESVAGYDALEPGLVRDFVDHLHQQKIHPILIFGTVRSGKTLLILSLLHYAKQDSNADMRIRLGEPVFPPEFPHAAERYRDAEQFYNNLTIEYARGERPPSTQKVVPFFVPVNIEAKGKTYKLAFLEGNGEWYERDDISFRQFKQEIVAILSGLAAPVSIIFVAPTRDDQKPGDRNFRDFSHICLANCVEQYEQHRLVRDGDNLLLLLTKWDVLQNPGRADSRFSDPSASDILTEIEAWHFIWQQFGNLNGPARAVTPYSAGWINEKGLFVREPKLQPIFNKFNRTVWNWLFGNVTAANSLERPPVRENLYTDVEVPKPTLPTLYQSLVRASLWI